MRFGWPAAVAVEAETTEPSDGTIASSIGRATAAPTPRRNVRRWMCHFLALMSYLCYGRVGAALTVLSCLIGHRGGRTFGSPPHLERDAVDDAQDQCRELGVVGPKLCDDCINRRLIVRLDASAQGERERVFRGGPDRKSTRLNSSHLVISYPVFCLK